MVSRACIGGLNKRVVISGLRKSGALCLCLCYAVRLLIGLTGDFPGGSVVKNPPANAGDTAWIPELRTSPGGHVKPL